MESPEIESIKTYAHSFARMKFFKKTCHPTYMTERGVFGIYESNLRTEMLDTMTMTQILLSRPMIEGKIMKFVSIKLNDIIDDNHFKNNILDEINTSEFNKLFDFHS